MPVRLIDHPDGGLPGIDILADGEIVEQEGNPAVFIPHAHGGERLPTIGGPTLEIVEHDVEVAVTLNLGPIQHRHQKALPGLSGREHQGPVGGQIVQAGLGRPIQGHSIDPDRPRRPAGAADPDRSILCLLHLYITCKQHLLRITN